MPTYENKSAISSMSLDANTGLSTILLRDGQRYVLSAGSDVNSLPILRKEMDLLRDSLESYKEELSSKPQTG